MGGMFSSSEKCVAVLTSNSIYFIKDSPKDTLRTISTLMWLYIRLFRAHVDNSVDMWIKDKSVMSIRMEYAIF